MFPIRKFQETDSVEQITTMLHRAYREHAESGLHFLATHQTSDVTLDRIRSGTTLVMTEGDRVVAILTVKRETTSYGNYSVTRPAASFSQFAVDPDYRGKGLGKLLLDYAEAYALSEGAEEMLLDTSQLAHNLIAMYQSLGYEIVASADWRPTVNYESWILRKPLIQDPRIRGIVQP